MTTIPTGAALKRLRESRDLALDDVAARMEVQAETLAAWETGTLHPTEDEAAAYQELLSTFDVEDEAQADETGTPFGYDITSYGADYPVDGLVSRLGKGDVEVPKFQRGYVWTFAQACKFIESLLLGLPVPGVFLYKDDESKKLIVIDGQQRLRTLQFFYSGVFKDSKVFKLTGVTEELKGAAYKDLSDELRRLLDDSILHATIIKQERPNEEDRSSIYLIFERLNTGGTPLTPQEIRTCVWRGEFVELLASLNNDENWKAVFGHSHPRMKDQELILRFFAMLHRSDEAHEDKQRPPAYRRPMKRFLNSFVEYNVHLQHVSGDELTTQFTEAIALGRRLTESRPFCLGSSSINAAVFDSVMVGLASRLRAGQSAPDHDCLKSAYAGLLKKSEYTGACSASTADNDQVTLRMRLATEAFNEC